MRKNKVKMVLEVSFYSNAMSTVNTANAHTIDKTPPKRLWQSCPPGAPLPVVLASCVAFKNGRTRVCTVTRKQCTEIENVEKIF